MSAGIDTLKVQRVAAKTRDLVKELRVFVSMMEFGDPAPRDRLSVALLMASLEHAEGMADLSSNGPNYFGMPSMALVRPQVDCLMRGVFFHAEASDDQLAYFLEHDKILKVPPKEKKGWVKLGDMETVLIRELEKITNELGSAPLTKLFPFDLDDLHGLVHGGRDFLTHYTIDGERMGFNMDPTDMFRIVAGSGLAAGYTMTYLAARIAVKNPPEETAELREANEAFRRELRGE